MTIEDRVSTIEKQIRELQDMIRLPEESEPERRYSISELREKYEYWCDHVPSLQKINQRFIDWIERNQP